MQENCMPYIKKRGKAKNWPEQVQSTTRSNNNHTTQELNKNCSELQQLRREGKTIFACLCPLNDIRLNLADHLLYRFVDIVENSSISFAPDKPNITVHNLQAVLSTQQSKEIFLGNFTLTQS
jgi:hypothetical protein